MKVIKYGRELAGDCNSEFQPPKYRSRVRLGSDFFVYTADRYSWIKKWWIKLVFGFEVEDL